MQPVLDFISNYSTVSDAEMIDMFKSVQFSSISKNEMLLTQGKLSRSLAFIIKGAVRTYYSDTNSDERTTGFVFENQPLVSLDGFFNETPSPVNACTLEATELVSINREEFFEFLEKHQRYEAILRNIISKHMRFNTAQSRLLLITSASERYETLMNTQPHIIQRIPLKFVASYLGISQETLSRVRAGKL